MLPRHLLGLADSDLRRSLCMRAWTATRGFLIWFLSVMLGAVGWFAGAAECAYLHSAAALPIFLRSGLLWHGRTLRLAGWLSSPLANDGGGSLSSSCTSPSSPSLPPSLPLLAVHPAADNTRSSTRHHQKIPPFLPVLPVSNDHAVYCICKCIWIGTRSGVL